jgi:hypothetical protein
MALFVSFHFRLLLFLLFKHSLSLYFIILEWSFSILLRARVCVFSYSVRVQSQIRVVSSSSIYLFFVRVSLNALDRENTFLTNSDTHTSSPKRFFFVFCVCLSYIHTSYLFCTCALRVIYCCCSL